MLVPPLCIEPQDLDQRAKVGRCLSRDLHMLAELWDKKADVLGRASHEGCRLAEAKRPLPRDGLGLRDVERPDAQLFGKPASTHADKRARSSAEKEYLG